MYRRKVICSFCLTVEPHLLRLLKRVLIQHRTALNAAPPNQTQRALLLRSSRPFVTIACIQMSPFLWGCRSFLTPSVCQFYALDALLVLCFLFRPYGRLGGGEGRGDYFRWVFCCSFFIAKKSVFRIRLSKLVKAHLKIFHSRKKKF
jgi:hypothetical protein